jgi:serine/threonine-protein kinase
MLGQLLDGRYKIIQTLGAGGFGQTFIAEDTKQFNYKCVVKQLKPLATDTRTLQVARRLFESEAQLLHRLGGHEQIPRLMAYFEEDHEFYLVQEFIDGHELSKELTPGKKLSESYVITLLRSTLEPLAFVHQNNVIHRDINPPT